MSAPIIRFRPLGGNEFEFPHLIVRTAPEETATRCVLEFLDEEGRWQVASVDNEPDPKDIAEGLEQRVLERAHQIDPQCFESYEGQLRSYKSAMDARRIEARRQARKELR